MASIYDKCLIPKTQRYFFLTIFIVGMIIISISEISNKSKKHNSKPPYIIENKYGIKTCKYLVIRPIHDNYNNSFRIKVGNFTYDSYQLGDTINNINNI